MVVSGIKRICASLLQMEDRMNKLRNVDWHRLTGVLLVAVVLVFAGAVERPVHARGAPESFADLAEGLLDAVVNISTSQKVKASRGIPVPQVPDGSPFEEFFEDFFNRNQDGNGQRSRKVQSLGSGFVIDPSGIIVTNNHVIADADEIVANFADGSKLVAEVIGRDTKTDLAVLKVNPDKPLKSVSLSDKEDLRVGDWVMAIGNPFGFGGTVTVGIVSALERDINSGPYDKFIQTDASINRGNSGGPLFNLDGEVVGINTAIISPSGGSIGIGFSIPSELALPVIDQLREFGETRRGWLGVRIQQVSDEIAESLGMDKARGALVGGVTEGSPAEAAGFLPGDVVLKFDGKDVPEMRDLPRVVADTSVGKAVDVVVLRKGEEVTIKVTLGRLEEGEKLMASRSAGEGAEGGDDAQPGKPEEVLGLLLGEITKEAREKYSIADDIEGVLVAAVAPGSAAEEKRISPGDVIVEVGQEKVSKPADVIDRVDSLKKAGRKSALLLVSSKNSELSFVPLRIDEDEEKIE